MYQDTQRTAQRWEQLLHATGGKLELQKCFYYPIIWQFDDEGIPTLKDSHDHHQVQITSSETGQPVTISAKSPHRSHKMLGIMENPSGNYNDEYKQIYQKSHKWKPNIGNQFLNRAESALFYHSFYLPSLR